jgi:hypothetical protein
MRECSGRKRFGQERDSLRLWILLPLPFASTDLPSCRKGLGLLLGFEILPERWGAGVYSLLPLQILQKVEASDYSFRSSDLRVMSPARFRCAKSLSCFLLSCLFSKTQGWLDKGWRIRSDRECELGCVWPCWCAFICFLSVVTHSSPAAAGVRQSDKSRPADRRAGRGVPGIGQWSSCGIRLGSAFALVGRSGGSAGIDFAV